MLYLIWGLLNLGLLIYFLVITYKATLLVKEKIGLFTSIFFVLVLLSFLLQKSEENYINGSNPNRNNTWVFASEDSLTKNATFFVNIELVNNWISKKKIAINYGKDTHGHLNIPISAYLTTTGFTSGTIWKPILVNVNLTDDNNKFQYFVVGLVEWKLLGATIYTQSKNFSGIVSLKESSHQ